MLLAIDIGNTNLTFGLFDGEKILHKFRLTTSLPRTSDEFGVQIMEQLSHQNVSAENVGGCGDLISGAKDHVFSYKRNKKIFEM